MVNLSLILALLTVLSSGSQELRVTVKGVLVGKGNVVIEVYDSKDRFFKKPILLRTIVADSETLAATFNIPNGTYAVSVYQDLNDNKVLDKGLFNIPKEPYGLSNNFRPHFAAPSFDDCKFDFPQQKSITIILK